LQNKYRLTNENASKNIIPFKKVRANVRSPISLKNDKEKIFSAIAIIFIFQRVSSPAASRSQDKYPLKCQPFNGFMGNSFSYMWE
jgi:hypothetical protein